VLLALCRNGVTRTRTTSKRGARARDERAQGRVSGGVRQPVGGNRARRDPAKPGAGGADRALDPTAASAQAAAAAASTKPLGDRAACSAEGARADRAGPRAVNARAVNARAVNARAVNARAVNAGVPEIGSGQQTCAARPLELLRRRHVRKLRLIRVAAGITSIWLRDFALATAIDASPRAFAWAALGGSLGNYSSPQALAAIGVLVAMAIGGAGLVWRTRANWRSG
jgi:hypothetical protein